jgi:hypothetical protein
MHRLCISSYAFAVLGGFHLHQKSTGVAFSLFLFALSPAQLWKQSRFLEGVLVRLKLLNEDNVC